MSSLLILEPKVSYTPQCPQRAKVERILFNVYCELQDIKEEEGIENLMDLVNDVYRDMFGEAIWEL